MRDKNTKQYYKSRGPIGKQLPPPWAKENEIPDKSIVKNKPDHRDMKLWWER